MSRLNLPVPHSSYQISASPSELEMYFHMMYQLIERHDPEDQIKLNSLLSQHTIQCQQASCICTKIQEKVDNLKTLDRRSQSYQSAIVNRGSQAVGEKTPDEAGLNDPEYFGSTEGPNTSFYKKRYNSKGTQKFTSGNTNDYNTLASKTSFKSSNPILKQDDPDFIELVERDETENLFSGKKVQKAFFKFLEILIKEQIDRLPTSVTFRLINGNLLKDKLGNNFKSCFLVLTCSNLNPSFRQKFEIFRVRNELELVIGQSQKKDGNKQGTINISQIHEYERLYSQYLFKEYQVTHSSLNFWRELMQKELDASAINTKGIYISKAYHQIQDIATQLQKRMPNDIKFMFRYSLFLLKVMNSDLDSYEILKKIQLIYELKTANKSAGNASQQQSFTEQQVFGENTASGIIMISANAQEIGRIIHANEEIEYLLGYTKNELIGVNVSIFLPFIFRSKHEALIQSYLESGKEKILHRRRKNFAVNKEFYLVPVELIIKIFPQINGKLIFAGFIQKTNTFSQMAKVGQAYEGLEQNYIMTDEQGYISNITEGLLYQLGLSSKFFSFKEITSMNRFLNIQMLCPDINYPEITDSFDTINGQVLQFDTSKILEQVEIEALSSEEVLEVRSNLGKYQVYTQFARWVISPGFCEVDVYRLIVVQRVGINEASYMHGNSKFSHQGLQEILGTSTIQAVEIPKHEVDNSVSNAYESFGSRLSQLQRSSSVHSFSSTSGEGSTQSIDGIIRDFKRKINERKTPKALIILNRLIILIIFGTLILTLIEFMKLDSEILSLQGENEHNLNSERRTLEFTELAVNSRSWLNAGMGIDFDLYDLEELNRLDRRYDLLGRFIQQQAWSLKEIHDFMTQQRVTNDAGTDELQTAFEYEEVSIYNLAQDKKIKQKGIQYRVGMYQFFNQIQNLNMTTREMIRLPEELIVSGIKDLNRTFNYNFTDEMRAAFFITVNGLRSLRIKTRQATVFQQVTSFENISQNPFMIIMIIATTITIFSQMVVLIQIWRIERVQSEILSLYALVSIDNIGILYDSCANYIQTLEECSLLCLVDPDGTNVVSSFLRIQSTLQKQSIKENDRSKNGSKYEGEISEEEKELQIYQDYLQAKIRSSYQNKRYHHKSQNHKLTSNKSEVDPELLGKSLYAAMIRRTTKEIKKQSAFQQSALAKSEASKNLVKQESQLLDTGNHRNLRGNQDNRQQLKGASIQRKKQLERTFEIKIKNEDDFISERLSDNDSSSGESNKDGDQKQKKISRKRSTKKEVEALKQLQRQQSMKNSDSNQSNDQSQDRKQAFQQSMRSQNKCLKTANILITLIFCLYFISTYFLHESFKDSLFFLQTSIPIFFNRYRFLLLTMGLLRERIISNNSLSTFESVPGYGYDIDKYYRDQSIENDLLLQEFKVNQPVILSKMIDFLLASDSANFCSKIIGQNNFYEQQSGPKQIKSSRGKTSIYQAQISTIIHACTAAFEGDIITLKTLSQKGVNFNQGDFNGLTPLYYAIRGNQSIVFDYLLQLRVNLNSVDKWGGSPLNYVKNGSKFEKLLLNAGAKRGKEQPVLAPPSNINLSDNEYRLLYAASKGDLQTIGTLKQLGVSLNIHDIESRTPLHIAASSGNKEIVEYLVDNGADVMKQDSRGIDPVDDAINSGFQEIHQYLDSVMSDSIIKKNCMTFANGLFSQGVQSAIGSFRKKFEDLQILINQTASYSQKMSLLKGDRYVNTSGALNSTTLKVYFQAQELYLSRALEYMVDSMVVTYEEYTNSYIEQTEIIFSVFIVIQLAILFWLRSLMISKMKREVFENRGILNLIPGHVFDHNKQEVETVIKKIKD